jgi:hypothetical protein
METHLDLLHALDTLNTSNMWKVVAGIGFIAVLLSVLVIVRRLNHLWEQVVEQG